MFSELQCNSRKEKEEVHNDDEEEEENDIKANGK